jgi:hypothetical protein
MDIHEDDPARPDRAGLTVDELEAGRPTQPELRRLLGFGTRIALDAFLKERGVYTDYDHADLLQDLRDLDRLGLCLCGSADPFTGLRAG